MSSDRRIPTSTYRLQLEPGFTFDDAAAQVARIADLGVSHLYLSPILQSVPGSTHGYDVIDHTRLAEHLGGQPGFDRLVAAAHDAGLGIIVDVVPNHMATPTPLWLNAPLWSVLRLGRDSPYAHWFDIDWAAQGGRVLLPVLGSSLQDVLAAGELAHDRVEGQDVLRYYDHVFPVAPGTHTVGMPLSEVLATQHYRLASWRSGGTDLNYRRFFDVTSLIAVRVEDPDVFDATHALLVDHLRSGAIDGLRIDHPDGLADPEGYLARLSAATDGCWVVVEKILEGHEQLPATWACAGTTGYDALLRVGGLFVAPDGAEPLTALSDDVVGEHQDLDEMIREAKRFVVDQVQAAEVNRLLRLIGRALPALDQAVARRGLTALLVAMDRYRIYVRPGELEPLRRAELDAVAGIARERDPELAPAVIEALVDLAAGEPVSADPEAQADFIVRFQQTCGPVMAKGIEDTTFYRYVRLTGLNEVGGDPGTVGVSTAEFHRYATLLVDTWPGTMTTLSTHDTKRSEDVRARLAVLSERPAAWATWLRRAQELAGRHRSGRVDAPTEYLLWQTLVGAWPLDVDRLGGYATKAIREAKLHTTWTEPDEDYERAIARLVEGLVTDPAITSHVDDWLATTAAATRVTILGQKLIQLTMPGIPDVYQGSELVDLSLVDPDNRRPIDHALRRDRLAHLDAAGRPADLSDEKLLVTAAALRLRRERPHVFVGPTAAYSALATDSHRLICFARGPAGRPEVVVLAARLTGSLPAAQSWGDASLELPAGRWRDRLGGREVGGGTQALDDVLPMDSLPVALYERIEDPIDQEGSP